VPLHINGTKVVKAVGCFRKYLLFRQRWPEPAVKDCDAFSQ